MVKKKDVKELDTVELTGLYGKHRDKTNKFTVVEALAVILAFAGFAFLKLFGLLIGFIVVVIVSINLVNHVKKAICIKRELVRRRDAGEEISMPNNIISKTPVIIIAIIIIAGIVVGVASGGFGGSGGSHECYVCGESGNIKYGSYYYCSTHYAYVKTVVDAN